jgi:hypothetical protein
VRAPICASKRSAHERALRVATQIGAPTQARAPLCGTKRSAHAFTYYVLVASVDPSYAFACLPLLFLAYHPLHSLAVP